MESLIRLECIQAGGGAFLVDHGRSGLRHLGIPSGGPADDAAAQRARTLLELPNDAVLLELTLDGGQWLISGKGQFVITGADMGWRINGRPVELYTTIDFDGDYLLDGGFAERGCRSYLAIKGQWECPRFLGSVSPGLPEVTKITAGWSVLIEAETATDYSSDLDIYQHMPSLPFQLKVIPGPEWEILTEAMQNSLLNTVFKVGQDSDRKGLRLVTQEEAASFATELVQMISSPVLPGTIQLPSSGPIVLLKDAQTVGGFPRVLLVDKLQDLDTMGQLKPGDEIQLCL